ncbi:beta propeller repeat protein [Nocardioides allogilvus]|uniref:hypothetical protein n=1 Tax=Nocardioides allogilvus TaxID=2072017 RepID=UPI000D2FF98C|nr:hypothetical protein [Nocardioides allogilvus]
MPGLFVRRLVAPLLPLMLLAGCTQAADPTPPPPAPTPTPTATGSVVLDRPSPEEIVDDPASVLREVQVAPGDPDTRVALWSTCFADGCGPRRLAIAVTADGFRTRTLADATWHHAFVRLSAGGEVVVLDYQRGLSLDVVRADGSVLPVDMVKDVAPVARGEVVAGMVFRPARNRFWATDPATATAHLVPVPDGTHQLIQTDTGQLRAITSDSSYAWSDDGGATWNRHFDALDPHLLPGFVTSTDDRHVVVGGGDGATLFPFSQLRRLEDDGDWSVVEPVDDPMAYLGPTAVLPDGRFVASVQSWSDNGLAGEQPRGTPPGIYVSEGDDWSTYERIESGAPFRTAAPFEPMVTDIDVTADAALITAIGPDQTTAWTSDDLGATWREMRAR